jgi:hypothetical protein
MPTETPRVHHTEAIETDAMSCDRTVKRPAFEPVFNAGGFKL